MANRPEVPPVPTARQVGPVFAFIVVGLVGGITFVVGGTQQDNLPLLIVGALTAAASAVWSDRGVAGQVLTRMCWRRGL